MLNNIIIISNNNNKYSSLGGLLAKHASHFTVIGLSAYRSIGIEYSDGIQCIHFAYSYSYSQIGIAMCHFGEHLLVHQYVALEDVGEEAQDALEGLGV